MQLWNDPTTTLPLASFARPEPRREQVDRRDDEHRAAVGERRNSLRRALRSLLRL